MLSNNFDDNIGIGLCLRDISGTCEVSTSLPAVEPPLFSRSTIAGPQNLPMIDGFLGLDISINVALDIRIGHFRNNTAVSLVGGSAGQLQPPDPLAGGAGLDILDVPYAILAGLVFENNYGRQGSGLHLDTCTGAVIWNCTFVGNNATHEGGAIATVNSHGKGILLGASVVNNSFALSGGGIYANTGASVTVTNNTLLFNNTAVTYGGAMTCDACQAVTVQLNTMAYNNVASQLGGAFYVTGCTIFSMNQSQMTGNW